MGKAVTRDQSIPPAAVSWRSNPSWEGALASRTRAAPFRAIVSRRALAARAAAAAPAPSQGLVNLHRAPVDGEMNRIPGHHGNIPRAITARQTFFIPKYIAASRIGIRISRAIPETCA